MGAPHDAARLMKQVERALERCADGSEVLPILHRLARVAIAGSEAARYANLKLAELLAERDPWRGAICARRVIVWTRTDDRAWAALGLCLTLLGHYRAATCAYRHALEAAPNNPWYAHNLGHLLDVTLGHSEAALPWLAAAYSGLPRHGGIATSFAHALAKAGRLDEARRVLMHAMREEASREHLALLKWLDAGAPAERIAIPVRPKLSAGLPRRRTKRAKRSGESQALERALVRGLENLPLDDRQRARARALARDPVTKSLCDGGASPESVAAAVAYAIVYVDDVPLSQAEVAASFRVSGSSLRGRFAALRSHLHWFADEVGHRRR